MPNNAFRRAVAGALVAAGLAFSALRIPTAVTAAPPCRYAISSEITIDNQTKLTWQRLPDGSSLTWAKAETYCAYLNAAGGEWRLPTIEELQTIIDEQTYNPAIDQTAFPMTQASYFWSSTAHKSGAGSIWRVNFFDGEVSAGSAGDMLYVRCVR
jgi:hypothetical protein